MMSYSLLEIAGEKLRCVLQRLQCRDVLDLHELFERGEVDAAAAAAVFRAKAKHRDIDPESFSARFEERLADYSRRWNDELAEHLGGHVPEYSGVERTSEATPALRRLAWQVTWLLRNLPARSSAGIPGVGFGRFLGGGALPGKL